MAIELPKLPYPIDYLEPHISAETLEYHHGKHHKTYVTKLNELIVNHELADAPLEQIVCSSSGKIFNNAAQIWNHNFYWNCLSPRSTKKPFGPISEAIDQEFGSFENFKDEFTNTAINTFGSGWAWLVKDAHGKLKIISTSNAETTLTTTSNAILTCDVWEHAYYIDYRNARPKYLDAFWNLVDWQFANSNLSLL